MNTTNMNTNDPFFLSDDEEQIQEVAEGCFKSFIVIIILAVIGIITWFIV